MGKKKKSTPDILLSQLLMKALEYAKPPHCISVLEDATTEVF